MFVQTIGDPISPAAAELRHPGWRREHPSHDKLRGWAAEQDDAQTYEALANWLIEFSTPEDRHRIMCSYNWDHGTAIPQWILRQTDTQPATVFTTLWRARPDRMVPALAEGRPLPEDVAPLLQLVLDINDLLNRRFYRPPFLLRCIAFEGHDPLVWETRGTDHYEAEARLIPAAAYRPIPGRVLDTACRPFGCPIDLSLLT